MNAALLLYGSTFVLVFALVFQSRCVNSGQKNLAAMNSFFISAGQLVVLKLGPDATGIEYVGYMLGGPCAVYMSMTAHDYMMKKGGSAINLRQRFNYWRLCERASHLAHLSCTLGLEIKQLSAEHEEVEAKRAKCEQDILALQGE